MQCLVPHGQKLLWISGMGYDNCTGNKMFASGTQNKFI